MKKRILASVLSASMLTGLLTAVPVSAAAKDTWDGTSDTTWYNSTATEFTLNTAEQLAGFSKLVDAGNSFAGKTIKLGADLDLFFHPENEEEPRTFDPIGDDHAFEGTFDGQNHTIYNMYQSGWALGYEWGVYGSIGLFGEINGATIKNLTMNASESFVEGGDVAGIAGSATGKCVFENITIENSIIATYNNGCGGLIGWSGAGEYTFNNIVIAEDTVLAGLWGSFDSSIGGIVGQGEPGATYNFKDVDIACRLDVYNDCTASYDYYNYRMCGMIIGRLAKTTTINGKNYPDLSQYNINIDNVNVTYGDWSDYHYCEPTPGHNGGRGMRVETGYQYGGLPADYDHSQCTTNHETSIQFDQIFGGAQYGVKGLQACDGVKVEYTVKSTTVNSTNEGDSTLYVNIDSASVGCTFACAIDANAVTLTAKPGDGYEFSHWKKENGEIVSRELEYKMTFSADTVQNIKLVAVFEEIEDIDFSNILLMMMLMRKFTVTATAGEGGTITPEGETSYHYSRKNVYTYTITPDEGYVIADVLLDGESIGAVESYDFVQLKKDHTIEAIFEKEAE